MSDLIPCNFNAATNYSSGALILVNKPLEWTSFDVVKKVRSLIKKKQQLKKLKVGHAGTLDPLASGLLIICTGKFTKKINEIQNQEKTYTGTLNLGATTPSFDLESKINKTFQISHITETLLEETKKKFIGEIMQKPPIFSALKKNGKRLYKFARENKTVEIKERKVLIRDFEITKINLPRINFKICCSKGTYIRSLAYDFGLALNSGAYLSALCREKIGNYTLAHAFRPNEIEEKIKLL